ncbi:hypothetical protein Tco_1517273 [Tanacetum coccineum]
MQKESVSKQGRKSAKAEPTIQKDKAFDELDDDEIDNMETEDAQEIGRTRYVILKKPMPTDQPDHYITLNRTSKIDPKDKGKKKTEKEDESNIESEAQRRFLAEQRAISIRNRPPDGDIVVEVTSSSLPWPLPFRAADSTEIQALYEKVKRFDESFTVIGSTEDERKIKEMNEGASDPDKKKKFVKEDVLTKVPAKPDVAEQGTKKRKGGHMKMLARKRKRPQPDNDSDDEHRKCLKIVTFEGTIDSEIMERKSGIARLNKVSSPDGDYLIIYRANGNFRAFNYLLEGDLKIMMESSIEENDQSDFWNNQQNWEIVRWRLYEACGVYILELEDGTVIHMLVKRRYPLSKDLLQRMLDFGLEVEGILLENAEPREIKVIGGEMLGTLEIRMGEDLAQTQRAQLSDASIEILAYTQALKKVEAQLVAHQKAQLWYEEKIRFMKIDLDDKTDVLTYHKKLLAEAEKEKEDLKAKVEKWHNSSKNLGKLLNTQMSANDKFRLGYGDYRYDGILSYENEVLQSVFMNKESDLENQPLYDRFVTAEGMHVVPPPMTGNYMPSGPDIEIDYSQFTYGPKQSQTSESETQTNAPSFFDIEVEMKRALPMEAYFDPFKNIIVFKKLIDFLGSLPVSLKNNDWRSEGYGAYKNIEGGEAWHSEFKVTTPSKRKFTRSFKTKETKRKLSGKFMPNDILKFDNFLD